MNEREWLIYLLNSDGQSYYIENGILHISSTPRPVRYGPDGWKDMSIGYERSIVDWGNVINFSLPFKFVLDAAEVLRTLLDIFNIETVVKLLIQRQSLFINETNYYFYYKFFYKGEIDLSTYQDTETDFTVNIMQGGISKSIKSFKNTAYQIEPNDVVVKMDGATMVGTKKFIVLDTSYAHGNTGAFTVKEMIPMQEAITEGNFFNIYFSPTPEVTTRLFLLCNNVLTAFPVVPVVLLTNSLYRLKGSFAFTKVVGTLSNVMYSHVVFSKKYQRLEF